MSGEAAARCCGYVSIDMLDRFIAIPNLMRTYCVFGSKLGVQLLRTRFDQVSEKFGDGLPLLRRAKLEPHVLRSV